MSCKIPTLLEYLDVSVLIIFVKTLQHLFTAVEDCSWYISAVRMMITIEGKQGWYALARKLSSLFKQKFTGFESCGFLVGFWVLVFFIYIPINFFLIVVWKNPVGRIWGQVTKNIMRLWYSLGLLQKAKKYFSGRSYHVVRLEMDVKLQRKSLTR